MFKYAVRGIPNFSHVTVHHAVTINEIFSHFHIKIGSGLIIGDARTQVYNIKGKRVMVYIEAIRDNTELLEKYCKPASGKHGLGMLIDPETLLLVGAGTMQCMRENEYWYIEPEHWPEYTATLATYRQVQAVNRKLEQARQEQEEQEDNSLSEMMQSARDKHGFEYVANVLRGML